MTVRLQIQNSLLMLGAIAVFSAGCAGDSSDAELSAVAGVAPAAESGSGAAGVSLTQEPTIDTAAPSEQPEGLPEETKMQEKAILAGGCFWGMEELFRQQPGVLATRCGYTGGDVPNATYRNHGTHAEAIEVIFDPSVTDFRKMLEFFFQIHDPTTLNRQGNDIGMSYRSAIYFTSDAQKKTALDTIADVNASGIWPGEVVTEVEPAGPFWEAEPEHQDYLQRFPNGYTCHFPRPDWVLPKREEAAEE